MILNWFSFVFLCYSHCLKSCYWFGKISAVCKMFKLCVYLSDFILSCFDIGCFLTQLQFVLKFSFCCSYFIIVLYCNGVNISY